MEGDLWFKEVVVEGVDGELDLWLLFYFFEQEVFDGILGLIGMEEKEEEGYE